MRIFATPCSVDATLGVRYKLILLGGYIWENGELFYKVDTLKAFGLLKVVEDTEFLVYTKLRWKSISRDYLYICGAVSDTNVRPCAERLSSGLVSIFDRALGGGSVVANKRRHISGGAYPCQHKLSCRLTFSVVSLLFRIRQGAYTQIEFGQVIEQADNETDDL